MGFQTPRRTPSDETHPPVGGQTPRRETAPEDRLWFLRYGGRTHILWLVYTWVRLRCERLGNPRFKVYRRNCTVMTIRPWARRWVTGVAVCASAVGLAALLGAAMTPPAAAPAAVAALAPTEQENYVAPPRQRHHRPRTLSPRAAGRPAFEPDPGPLSRRHRRRPELFLRERHRRVREVPVRARRRHQGRRRGACVRDFPALSAAQPRADELRGRAAREEARFRRSTNPSISIARRSRGRRTPPR